MHPSPQAPQKINVLFPEMSQYFLGSVGREIFFWGENFLYRKKHENHSKYPKKKEKKISNVPKKFRVGPKKSRVGRVSGNKTFFFLASECIPVLRMYSSS